MYRKLVVVLSILVLAGCSRSPQSVLEDAAQAMGATNLKTIHYAGSGYHYTLGQNVNPNDPWPRYNLTTYSRMIDYEAVASSEEIVRDGGFRPHATQLVSGNYAWNLTGTDPTPQPNLEAAAERQIQIWLTPHGSIQAALAANPIMQAQTVDGRRVYLITFMAQGKFPVSIAVNEDNLVERVEARFPNPVLGDMPIRTTYSNYQDFGDVRFPTHIMQEQGGYTVLEVNVSQVHPNMAATIAVPEPVRQATGGVRVESEKLADGVWLIAGGSHNSVAVEFADHVAVVEAPLHEARSVAVIAEVKQLVPGKPIRYLVNTHHHFDHSGGIRTYVAERATLITHEINRAFYERVFQAPHMLEPDQMMETGAQPQLETLTEKHVLSDGTRTLEIHHIQDNEHSAGILMAYLPRESLLIEADVWNPPPPGTPPPATPNPITVNFYENITRLNLRVNRIVPIHGSVMPVAELRRVIGRR